MQGRERRGGLVGAELSRLQFGPRSGDKQRGPVGCQLKYLGRVSHSRREGRNTESVLFKLI